MHKKRDLAVITVIYALSYLAGIFVCSPINSSLIRLFVFDSTATLVTFAFSVLLKNSSVYDAYWSLTPMVMSLYLFISAKAFSIWHILFFIAFNIWSLRLTLNWVSVFSDFSYEDWRYRKYRNETSKYLWPLVNFFGIHYIPTLVVFLGMLPIFSIIKTDLGILSLPGIALILTGIVLEFYADKQMHAFLSSPKAFDVCRIGLWNYSRHPNYLGEITVWFGVFLTMLPYSPEHWFYAIGFISIALLFNIVSIPLMENRQLERRPGYAEYTKSTSRLIIRPHIK